MGPRMLNISAKQARRIDEPHPNLAALLASPVLGLKPYDSKIFNADGDRKNCSHNWAASGCGAPFTTAPAFVLVSFCSGGLFLCVFGLLICSWNKASDFHVTPASTCPCIRKSGVCRW